VFCIYLKTNSDLAHLHHKLIGFYKRVEKRLLRGTGWVFKLSSLRFVFKGLNDYFSPYLGQLINYLKTKISRTIFKDEIPTEL
jgi:hypothetical protein